MCKKCVFDVLKRFDQKIIIIDYTFLMKFASSSISVKAHRLRGLKKTTCSSFFFNFLRNIDQTKNLLYPT